MTLQPRSFDLAVVGAGVVGLGCALAAAKQGRRVVVIDRDAQANGASVRNFGFVTVTGQQRGAMWRRAMRSRDLWEETARAMGLEILHRGLLMTVRRPEAMAVLEAFLATEMAEGCRLFDGWDLRSQYPEMGGHALGALYSPHELRVESTDALPRLAAYLQERFGVVFLWSAAVLGVESHRVATTRGLIEAEGVCVCPGDDLSTLFSDIPARHGVTRCKLQMLRLEPPGFRLPAGVMSDLGLVRYSGYAALPEAQPLRVRLEAEQGEHVREGVHLIVVQSADGSLVVGDSHEYGATPDPFSRSAVDALILEEFTSVFGCAPPPVRLQWTGTYSSSPSVAAILETPREGVCYLMVTTGAGASTGFALGEEAVLQLFGATRS